MVAASFRQVRKECWERGEYYLFETSGLNGYVKNDTAIHIIVDNTGVYADAGNADDGVSVLKGVGSIVKSMVQFATDDNVDTTLNTIKADCRQWTSMNTMKTEALHGMTISLGIHRKQISYICNMQISTAFWIMVLRAQQNRDSRHTDT